MANTHDSGQEPPLPQRPEPSKGQGFMDAPWCAAAVGGDLHRRCLPDGQTRDLLTFKTHPVRKTLRQSRKDQQTRIRSACPRTRVW
jgi:hypothetical protein